MTDPNSCVHCGRSVFNHTPKETAECMKNLYRYINPIFFEPKKSWFRRILDILT